jgi:hypothetical protein
MKTGKTVNGQWSTESLKLVVSAVKSGTPLAAASTIYGTPSRTIRDYVNGERSALKMIGRNAFLHANDEKIIPPCNRMFATSLFWTDMKSCWQDFCSRIQGTQHAESVGRRNGGNV